MENYNFRYSGTGQQPKHEKIVSAANEIVSRWEQEQLRTS